jgi:hypothetical protein
MEKARTPWYESGDRFEEVKFRTGNSEEEKKKRTNPLTALTETRKEKAIRLRKEGKTYLEIIAETGAANCTISNWLKEAGMTRPHGKKNTKAVRVATKIAKQEIEQETLVGLAKKIDGLKRELKLATEKLVGLLN